MPKPYLPRSLPLKKPSPTRKCSLVSKTIAAASIHATWSRAKSFQRAVLEKREDALHALSDEVRSNALLAPRAARFLAAIR